ncbi:hypothetical protein FQN57_005320 [Myotisia sp. PD_48]|nr:hypothetical protein FQN57_005320 [Myotisia sp. PD_48]
MKDNILNASLRRKNILHIEARNPDVVPTPPPEIPSLLSLPVELVYQIISYLSCVETVSLSSTCHVLYDLANDDQVWSRLVNANLPTPLTNPSPFSNFKSLYTAHHPLWFLVRNKIWFSDVENSGKLILARYDPGRGCIEAYRLVARQSFRQFTRWEKNPNVLIASFEPRVSLWLDDPVMKLEMFTPSDTQLKRPWDGEIRMPMTLESQNVYSMLNLIKNARVAADAIQNEDDDSKLIRAVQQEMQSWINSSQKPLWPPAHFPSDERVISTSGTDFNTFDHICEAPDRLDDICQSAFRIRRWLQFGGRLPNYEIGAFTDGLSTYATIRPELYTPTPEKPYQGIWVGDYSGHGPEFLIFLQRDEPRIAPGTTPATASPTDSQSQTTSLRGPLEAIKLTGDPNIPRGEISFIAEDLGPRGLIRTADEEPFRGARVVRSKGHVASLNFRDDKFIDSELILISHDLVAHYWCMLGHVAYFRRVDIDQALNE